MKRKKTLNMLIQIKYKEFKNKTCTFCLKLLFLISNRVNLEEFSYVTTGRIGANILMHRIACKDNIYVRLLRNGYTHLLRHMYLLEHIIARSYKKNQL